MTLPKGIVSEKQTVRSEELTAPWLSIVHCQLSIPIKEVLLCRIYMT